MFHRFPSGLQGYVVVVPEFNDGSACITVFPDGRRTHHVVSHLSQASLIICPEAFCSLAAYEKTCLMAVAVSGQRDREARQ
jgi:hypothetical protein